MPQKEIHKLAFCKHYCLIIEKKIKERNSARKMARGIPLNPAPHCFSALSYYPKLPYIGEKFMYIDTTGLVPSSVEVSIFFIKIKVCSNYSF